MGEEDYSTGLKHFVLTTADGHSVDWEGFTEIQVTGSEVDHEENKVYAVLDNTASMSFEINGYISRKAMLLFLVGDNKRAIRRALRWYEKLRRQEIKGKYKFDNKLNLAAKCARFKRNNGKRGNHPHIYQYTIRTERTSV